MGNNFGRYGCYIKKNNKHEEEGYKDKNHKHEEECYKDKNHNHEFQSSTDYERDDEGVIHNHRIAGVTGPAIKCGKSHVHKVNEFTDTFGDHFHGVCDTTGPAIELPGGKHIHIVKGQTTCNDGHRHDFYFTTLIEDPTEVPEDRDC